MAAPELNRHRSFGLGEQNNNSKRAKAAGSGSRSRPGQEPYLAETGIKDNNKQVATDFGLGALNKVIPPVASVVAGQTNAEYGRLLSEYYRVSSEVETSRRTSYVLQKSTPG